MESSSGSESSVISDTQNNESTGAEITTPVESEVATPTASSSATEKIGNESMVGLKSSVNNDTQNHESPTVTASAGIEVDASTALISEATVPMAENAKAETKVSVNATPVPAGLPVRNIPKNHQVNDGGIDEVFKDAAHLDNPKADVVFEEVDSSGRGGGSRFEPNVDPNRSIKTYLPKNGEFVILPIGRNSDKPSEGGLIGSSAVEFGFGFKFFSAVHKLQVTLILVTGQHLLGYVLKGEGKGARRALYFPKQLAENVITLPQNGKVIKLQVAKFLVG